MMEKFLSLRNRNVKLVTTISIIINLALIVVSLSLGRYNISIFSIFSFLFGQGSSTDSAVIVNLRLPRILGALLVGATLAQDGAVYQAMFNNPLASSYILGVSSGAGFGAALAILLFNDFFFVELFAFIFGVLSVMITLSIARARPEENISLVLGGFIVGSLFQSFTSFLKYVADPNTKLPEIVFWLMGSLSQITLKQILILGPVCLALIVVVSFIGFKLNILSFGDEEAIALGENPKLLRGVLIALTTLQTAIVVSLSGVIGWVGLVIPHLVRFLVGYDNRYVLVLSVLFGSAYMLLIDTLARTLLPAEIPIGILTGIIGTPFFLALIRRKKA